MRKNALFVLLVLAVVGSVFLMVGASSAVYGIVDIAFCLLIIEFLCIKRYEKAIPILVGILDLALSITGFFALEIEDIGPSNKLIATLGVLLGFASGVIAIIYFSTFAQNYVIKKAEIISCSIGLITLVVALIASYVSNLSRITVYLIPAFFSYLFIIVSDSLKTPSVYFKLTHLLLATFYLTVGTTLFIQSATYEPVFTYSIIAIAISTFNIVFQRDYY